jgi:hypothetical protein
MSDKDRFDQVRVVAASPRATHPYAKLVLQPLHIRTLDGALVLVPDLIATVARIVGCSRRFLVLAGDGELPTAP